MQTDANEERQGRLARQQTAANAVSKAMKGLVGGLADLSATEKERLTTNLIPRSMTADPCITQDEQNEARMCAWGGGDTRQAKAQMREANRDSNGQRGIPWVRLAPLAAPGPS